MGSRDVEKKGMCHQVIPSGVKKLVYLLPTLVSRWFKGPFWGCQFLILYFQAALKPSVREMQEAVRGVSRNCLLVTSKVDG